MEEARLASLLRAVMMTDDDLSELCSMLINDINNPVWAEEKDVLCTTCTPISPARHIARITLSFPSLLLFLPRVPESPLCVYTILGLLGLHHCTTLYFTVLYCTLYLLDRTLFASGSNGDSTPDRQARRSTICHFDDIHFYFTPPRYSLGSMMMILSMIRS